MGRFILLTQEVRNEIILNADLAKRSVWIINNYDVVSGHKCKTTAVETKKRLEQLSKQLKVIHLFNPYYNIHVYKYKGFLSECVRVF